MVDQIRARFYVIVRSKTFLLVLVACFVWVLFSAVGLVTGDPSEPVNTSYILVQITRVYLEIVPIAAAGWYICYRKGKYQNQIPCQQYEMKSLLGNFGSAMCMNTFFMLGNIICSLVVILLMRDRILFSSFLNLGGTLVVLFLISVSRTAWTCLCTELVRDHVVGTVLGLISSTALLQTFLLDGEIKACGLLGIKASSLPVTSYTTYCIHEALFKGNGKVVLFNHINPYAAVLVLIGFIAVFSLGTVLLVQKRDVA